MIIKMSKTEFDSVNKVLRALTDGESDLHVETFEWKTVYKEDSYEVEIPEGYITSSNTQALPYIKILMPSIRSVVETFKGMTDVLGEISSAWQTEWEKKKKEKEIKEKETKEN